MDNLLVILIFVTFIVIYFTYLYFTIFNFTCTNNNLVLYYDLSADNIRDSIIVDLNNKLDSNLKYYSIQHAFMTDNNFIKNKDMISFLGMRTKGNETFNIPTLYKEEVSIKMDSGDYVVGSSIYTDTGNNFKTVGIPFVEYTILSKTCMFENYNKIRIYLDNINNTRKVVFFNDTNDNNGLYH